MMCNGLTTGFVKRLFTGCCKTDRRTGLKGNAMELFNKWIALRLMHKGRVIDFTDMDEWILLGYRPG